MTKFKNERDWKDLEHADKMALLVGVLMFLAFESGCFYQATHLHQQQKHKNLIFKTWVLDKNR